MNCLDTRRMLLADPRAESAALSAHLSQCEVCRAFMVRLQRDEVILHQTIEIPVPPQLEDRILLKMHLHHRRSMSRTAGQWQLFKNLIISWLTQPQLGLSAMVLACAMFASWTILSGYIQPVSWGEVVLSEVIDEPNALRVSQEVPRQAVLAALQDYGLTLKEGMGKVQYLNHCSLPGGKGIHAVIETPDLGKVSLIIPPIGVHPTPNIAKRDGYAAQIVQLSEFSIGVVTEQPDKLNLLTDRFQTYLVASN